MTTRKKMPKWTPTGTVSDRCEVRRYLEGRNWFCCAPATYAYPAMGGGYFSMCDDHAQKHLDICVTIEQAKRGEVPDLMAVISAPSEHGRDGE